VAGVQSLVPGSPALAVARKSGTIEIADGAMALQIDVRMRTRVGRQNDGKTDWLTPACASESLQVAHGDIDDFTLLSHASEPVFGLHGRGRRLVATGTAHGAIEKTVRAYLYERYPGFAMIEVSYRNLGQTPLAVQGWTNGALRMHARAGHSKPHFWSFNGGTYPDRRDWLRPLDDGFAQDNFLGMTASDYGSGTPVVDVWRKDCGLAVGHLATSPRLVSLPVRCEKGMAHVSVVAKQEHTIAPQERFDTLETFVAVHGGDYFATLDSYRRIMGDRGLHSPEPPEASYEPIWCAWGYEREVTTPMIEGTLPKAHDLGLRWAVVDDGWQSAVGDWFPNRNKYPRGDADMKQLVASIRDNGMKARLWYTPLAAAPGSDMLHDHTDMLLLDPEGEVRNISWWNSFYLCPAYEPTIEATRGLVRKFLGEWGYAGLKVDGQHLNGVAPCYNPAHKHARPEESVEKLQDFYRAIYETARQINPDAVIEICPCGTEYAFFNFPSMNQAPASDPESSWQVRLKGKTLKALMGPRAPFAGDHVELSDGGDDFASTVGIGAIVSTKFTWPVDPKPKDSFLLTPEREALWRKWIAIYNEKMLPKSIYRGELYDIGFDKPEAHVVETPDRMYYAFYAPRWKGAIPLRGLRAGRYSVRDYFRGTELGVVTKHDNRIHASFERFLLLEAVPA